VPVERPCLDAHRASGRGDAEELAMVAAGPGRQGHDAVDGTKTRPRSRLGADQRDTTVLIGTADPLATG